MFARSIEAYKYIINYGGAGSSKSYTTVQKIVKRIAQERNHNILVVRKSKESHRNSTYKLFKSVFTDFGLAPLCEFVSTPLEIRLPEFNSTIIFLGCDDPEKLKSLADISSIWVEEITELDKEDFSELEDRLRHPKHVNQIYITFNPVSDQHWIYDRFFKEEDERAWILKTTYLDNKFLTADYIQQREMQAKTDPRRYRIYTLGEWGILDRNNLYYHGFDPVEHIAKEPFKLNKELGVMVSLDFNVVPHITGLMIQVQGNKVYVQEEVALASPKNNVMALGKEIAGKIGWYDDVVTVFGDASGRNRTTVTEYGDNNFTLFNSELVKAGKRVYLSVDNANPSLSTRQIFVNNIFTGATDIEVIIHPKCKQLIADLMNQKVTMESNGKIGINKQKTRNKETGETYEKYGHSGDAFCYFLTRYFAVEYNKLKNGNHIQSIKVRRAKPNEHLF